MEEENMSYRNYPRDPFWLSAKYAGVCKKCGEAFKAGDRIFYYPNGKAAYSGKCADAASADFSSCAGDEAAYNGTGSIAY
jgi:hypothetical protein